MTPRGFNTALELYRTGTLSLGRAARFAGCTPTELRTAAQTYGVGDDDPDASQSEGTAERVEAQ
jgi:predicted HTH domain antitoxin